MNDEGFRVDSAEKAAVVMRKYRKLAQKKEQNNRLAELEHNRIDRWVTGVNASVEAQMEFLEGHLSAYAISQRAAGVKSVALPDGSIKTRQSGVTFEVDASVFLEWAQDAKRDDLVRVSHSPNMAAIKSSVIANGADAIDPASGEIVPGLQPVPERVTVKIEPDLEAMDLDGFEDEEESDVE